MRRGSGLLVAVMVLSACGSARVGGPSPEDVAAIATVVPANATAEQVAQYLTQRRVDFAILSGARDSAFFAAVATGAGLKSTRPGAAGATTFAFLGTQPVGDTTLALKVTGGGEVRVHDALYRIGKNRHLDLMAARIEPNANLKESIRTLLAYVATDVMANAAVLLAIEPPTPALGDSVSILMRAAFADAWECTNDGHTKPVVTDLPLRLFYGPAVRLACRNAERVDMGGGALFGHFVMGR